jgi:hypothetical protein
MEAAVDDPNAALRGPRVQRIGEPGGAHGDDLQIETLRENRRGLRHGPPVALELGAAAARKEHQATPCLFRERRGPGEAFRHVLDERMAGADGVGAEAAVDLGFEWKERDDPPGAARNRPRPPPPPGPDLGADVVDERHTVPPEAPRKEPVKVGKSMRTAAAGRRRRASADKTPRARRRAGSFSATSEIPTTESSSEATTRSSPAASRRAPPMPKAETSGRADRSAERSLAPCRSPDASPADRSRFMGSRAGS